MSAPTYIVEVDWNGDDDFLDANDDITANVLRLEWSRGRGDPSQITARAEVGRATVIVDNEAGKYSSFNTSSPLSGQILARRAKLRIRTTAPVASTRWTGYIDTIIPRNDGGRPIAEIRASGPFSRVMSRIEAPRKDNATTDQIITEVLDRAGWSATDRSIEIGQTSVPVWFVGDIRALDAMRDIEETEFGYLYEGADGSIVFEDRHFRLKGDRLTSQATYSDSPSATLYYMPGSAQHDPLRDLFNRIQIRLEPTEVQAEDVIWTLGGTAPVIQPSETEVFWAEAPDTLAYVEEWTTPSLGTDIIASVIIQHPFLTAGPLSLTITEEKFARAMKISITNNSSIQPVRINKLQARGLPVEPSDTTLVISEDTAHQAEFGIRTFQPSGRNWSNNFNDSKALADFLLHAFKVPRPSFTLVVRSIDNTLLSDALTRDVSERVTVQAQQFKMPLGLDQDFHIEGISERVDAHGMVPEITFLLAPVLSEDRFWILGTSELNTDTRVGF